MSLLSDYDIRRALSGAGYLKVSGLKPGSTAIQPASIDLTLGKEFRYYPRPVAGPLDFGSMPSHERVIDPLVGEESGGIGMVTIRTNKAGDTFDVRPGQFVLAHTAETLTIGPALAAQVYGKSSLGRAGLRVENAGYIDPGFSGQITLELRNETDWTIRLTVGMPICQIVLHRLSSSVDRQYGDEQLGSRYQGQTGATPSRYGLFRGEAEAAFARESRGTWVEEI